MHKRCADFKKGVQMLETGMSRLFLYLEKLVIHNNVSFRGKRVETVVLLEKKGRVGIQQMKDCEGLIGETMRSIY